jgi:signal transduction histidine kinase
MINRWENYWKITFIVGGLLLGVIYWDYAVLKVQMDTLYFVAKGSTLAVFFLSGVWAIWKKDTKYLQPLIVVTFFLYSFYGLAKLDMSYYFSFIEGFIFFGFILVMKPKHFLPCMLLGYGLFLWSLSLSTEPPYIIPGQSIKPHVLVATSIIAFLSMVFFQYVTMYREKILDLNEKFALIGKQSSFLMHEIKNPLSRVVHRAEMLDKGELVDDIINDSNRISSIIQGIEVLVSSPERFKETFEVFKWQDILADLEKEFTLVLHSYDIKLTLVGIETEARGNRYLIYQVLKNMITNALEAIQGKKEAAEISVVIKRDEQGLELKVLNTKSKIPKSEFTKIFDALYTTKVNSKNKGLGLTFARNIIEGHAGSIEVSSSEVTTAFTIRLPETMNV